MRADEAQRVGMTGGGDASVCENANESDCWESDRSQSESLRWNLPLETLSTDLEGCQECSMCLVC